LTLAQFALFGLCKKSTGGASVGDQVQRGWSHRPV
jgi:hypothetical protein